MRKKNINNEQNYKFLQILNMFVGNDEMRPSMMSPFIQGDYVVATDSKMAIAIKHNLINNNHGFIEYENAPNVLSIVPKDENILIELQTSVIKEAVLKLKQMSLDKYDITVTKCPDCKGGGHVQYEYNDYKGSYHYQEDTCPTCEGENEEFEFIKDKKTGNEVDIFEQLIKIGDAYLQNEQIEKVVHVAELLSIENISLSYRLKDGLFNCKFTIGEVVIVLMSLIPNEDDVIL